MTRPRSSSPAQDSLTSPSDKTRTGPRSISEKASDFKTYTYCMSFCCGFSRWRARSPSGEKWQNQKNSSFKNGQTRAKCFSSSRKSVLPSREQRSCWKQAKNNMKISKYCTTYLNLRCIKIKFVRPCHLYCGPLLWRLPTSK